MPLPEYHSRIPVDAIDGDWIKRPKPRRLPNGSLEVPVRVESDDGVIGDGLAEIGPDHPNYQEWSDRLDVARLVAAMEADGYASWTIRGTLTVLGGILGYAARRGYVATNVVRQLERDERPAHTQREGRVLDADDLRPFVEATPKPYRSLIAAAIFTGLRQGERSGCGGATLTSPPSSFMCGGSLTGRGTSSCRKRGSRFATLC